ncbi:GNAT family N-acetyltransferase [Cohnella rhizosphaerae]|uniref:GNAT family N-acetyltransferase n=1 Tax=Cohnella rhizosphaerae TaxID=1457232 RepID=A0A9X4KQG5_9BACL|nr:GNAT family N-acetyltransferase [Cohnella rhizosphaerae]MDG0809254.1 GNAT family N-acetyltransferase [Cohnella rhizosphaerae]
MHIRDAAPQERAMIRSQRLEAYREHAQSVPDGHWQALAQAIDSEADAQPGAELIVAESEGQIAGSVVLFPANTDAYDGHADKQDYPEIRMLAVSPAHRGKGVASALIAECVRRARASGSRAVGLHTGEFMKDARQLYEKLGFERLPQYDFYPADDGIKVLAFRLNL